MGRIAGDEHVFGRERTEPRLRLSPHQEHGPPTEPLRRLGPGRVEIAGVGHHEAAQGEHQGRGPRVQKRRQLGVQCVRRPRLAVVEHGPGDLAVARHVRRQGAQQRRPDRADQVRIQGLVEHLVAPAGRQTLAAAQGGEVAEPAAQSEAAEVQERLQRPDAEPAPDPGHMRRFHHQRRRLGRENGGRGQQQRRRAHTQLGGREPGADGHDGADNEIGAAQNLAHLRVGAIGVGDHDLADDEGQAVTGQPPDRAAGIEPGVGLDVGQTGAGRLEFEAGGLDLGSVDLRGGDHGVEALSLQLEADRDERMQVAVGAEIGQDDALSHRPIPPVQAGKQLSGSDSGGQGRLQPLASGADPRIWFSQTSIA